MADKRSALLVATGTYEDPALPPLLGPALDVRALERVLGDPQIGGFEVDVALDLDVQDLRVRLFDFFQSRTLHDTLLVHFSCHGLKDDGGRLYFAAADTQNGRLFATGISDKWLQDLIDECRSERIVLMLDCCFGGSFATSMAWRAAGSENVGIKERFDGKGRLVLSASTSTQYALDGGIRVGEPQPSIFTKAIAQGLATGEADRDRDGRVSIDELYDYAVEALREQEAPQTPTKAGYVEGDLFLAENPFLAASPPASTPGPTPPSRAPDDLGRHQSSLERARIHVVSIDEDLAAIAFSEYGDVALWRGLATFNAIDNPLELPDGSVLIVPAEDEARRLS